MSLANQDWYVLRNPFDRPTNNSYTMLDILATDHLSKLRRKHKTNEAINALYEETHPKVERFLELFRGIKSDVDAYRDATAAVTAHFAKLFTPPHSIMDNWEARLLVDYPRHSAEYKNKLFPHGRTKFRQGGHEQRARELERFVLSFEGLSDLTPPMKDLLVDVKAFVAELVRLRDAQQQIEGNLAENRHELAMYREVLLEQMNFNKDSLLVIHRTKRQLILTYFQMDLLRTKKMENGQEVPPDDIDINTTDGSEDDFTGE